MNKIAVIEPTGIDINAYHQALPHCEIMEIDSRNDSDEKLIHAIKDCSIIALANRPLSARVLKSLPHLKFISVAFAGIDHLDAEAIKAQGIIVKNAAGYASTAVAELVVGFMISLARNIPLNNNQIRHGGVTNTGMELKGKCLGIIGYGAIGKEISRLATAFQMNILIYDQKSATTLEDIFKAADFVSLHVPLTPQTKGMVDKKLLQHMKKTAFLINCARGPIVNADDLEHALSHRLIAGAALDVFDNEPPLPSGDPLLKLPNVIATPHIGYNTQEACLSKGQMALNNIIHYLDGFNHGK